MLFFYQGFICPEHSYGNREEEADIGIKITVNCILFYELMEE